MPLRLAGFEVVVVEPDAAHRERARARAGEALAAAPAGSFDAVVAPDDLDLGAIDARRVVRVRQDGSVWSSPAGSDLGRPARG
ncbi:MAG: hypothetical protein ACYDBR_02065 [Gaiellaceae bacterium]